MDSPVTILLLVVGVPAAFVIAFVVVVYRRGLQMNQLIDDGIETTGTIISKHSHRRGGVKSYHLRYRYTDQQGVGHSHRSMVEGSVYRALEKDGVIPVIYSASRPSISAPGYLVEQVRAAKTGQQARRAAR